MLRRRAAVAACDRRHLNCASACPSRGTSFNPRAIRAVSIVTEAGIGLLTGLILPGRLPPTALGSAPEITLGPGTPVSALIAACFLVAENIESGCAFKGQKEGRERRKRDPRMDGQVFNTAVDLGSQK